VPLRRVSTVPMRVLRTDFLIRVAVIALQRWDRLETTEQTRFRLLANRFVEDRPALSKDDRRELRALWKRLEVRRMVFECARLGARTAGEEEGSSI
jgi:hypothetical protein